jgi:hypothetical protein
MIQVCMERRAKSGGLDSASEILQALRERRGPKAQVFLPLVLPCVLRVYLSVPVSVSVSVWVCRCLACVGVRVFSGLGFRFRRV